MKFLIKPNPLQGGGGKQRVLNKSKHGRAAGGIMVGNSAMFTVLGIKVSGSSDDWTLPGKI